MSVNYLLVTTFWGSVIGLGLAWWLMKVTWLDMRLNTGLCIPLGMIAGFIYGLTHLRDPLTASRSKVWLFLLVIFCLLTLVGLSLELEAVPVVVPALVRQGFYLKEVSLRHINYLLLSWVFLGVVCSLLYWWRHTWARR